MACEDQSMGSRYSSIEVQLMARLTVGGFDCFSFRGRSIVAECAGRNDSSGVLPMQATLQPLRRLPEQSAQVE